MPHSLALIIMKCGYNFVLSFIMHYALLSQHVSALSMSEKLTSISSKLTMPLDMHGWGLEGMSTWM